MPSTLTVSPNWRRNREILLQLTHEFDVKAKFSGKGRIFLEGKPYDLLGYFLVRIGWSAPTCTGWGTTNPYNLCRQELGLCRKHHSLQAIWREIDRPASTNESIRNKIKEVFASHQPN